MFSRAHMIWDAFDSPATEDTTEVPEELEKQEDVVFHTLGNLHQYKGLLPEDTEEGEEQKDVMFHTLGTLGSLEQYQDVLLEDVDKKE